MTVYSAAQAAEVCQVSLRTVQRRLPALETHGAWKDSDGKWRIPVAAMHAAGMRPGRPASPDSDGDKSLRHDVMSQSLSQDMAQHQEQLAHWRERALVAEALAAERERTIAAQSYALKMLEAAPAEASTAVEAVSRSPEPVLKAGGLLGRLLRF